MRRGFPGAGGAGDEGGHRVGAGAGDADEDGLEAGGTADEGGGVGGVRWGEGRWRIGVEEGLEGGFELPEVEGFGEVEGGAGLLGGDGVVEGGVGGDDEDGEAGVLSAEPGEDVEAAEVWQADVEDDGVKAGGLGGLEGGPGGGGEFGEEADAAGGGGEGNADGVLVFDDEDALLGHGQTVGKGGG